MRRKWVGSALSMSLLLFVPGAGGQTAPAPGVAQPAEPPPIITPPAPKRPFELAPVEPHITCSGNQLSIVADNATMASVLEGISRCTGVAIEVPVEAATERVYSQQGSGPVREMLETLLSATQYDYLIAASNVELGKLKSVVLMTRNQDKGEVVNPTGMMLTPARRAWLASRQSARPGESAVEGVDSRPDQPLTAARTEPTLSAEMQPAVVPANDAGAAIVDKGSSESVTADGVASTAPVPAIHTEGSTGPVVAAATEPLQSKTPPDAAVAVPENGAAPAPAPTDAETPTAASSAPAAVSKETQERISNMQQLFEQRKQLTTGQTAQPRTQQ